MLKDSFIKFNVTKSDKVKFQKLFPSRGQQSKALRAVLQLLLNGQIQRSQLQYKEQV